MEPKILYSDDQLILIDKPSGWITNSASTTGNQPVLQDFLVKNYQFPIFKFKECRNGIVHRLDKETSGILLVAKTKKTFEDLQKQFKERIVQKSYIALIHGRLEPMAGEIKAPVGRLPWRRDRFGILPGGRASHTNYELITYHQNSETKEIYSLVRFEPKTGRTHQIRIHAKYLGHPIVSDQFYAGRKTARNDRKWCQRLFLHASGINFIHPIKNIKMKFESVLPEDLKSSLRTLEKVL